MALLTMALGIAMVAIALANGGGPFAFGVLLGLAFAGVGAARLYLSRG